MPDNLPEAKSANEAAPQDVASSTPDGVPAAFPLADSAEYRASLFVSMRSLPPPDVLKGYNKSVPNAADRILTMIEQQMVHRHRLERYLVRSELRRAGLGMLFGFIVSLVCLIGSFVIIDRGAPIAGSCVATGTLVSLVGTFVYGNRSRVREQQHKTDLSNRSTQ